VQRKAELVIAAAMPELAEPQLAAVALHPYTVLGSLKGLIVDETKYAAAVAAMLIQGFKRMLNQMWFELYNRDGAKDSSGFEHVFVGEHDTSDGELCLLAQTNHKLRMCRLGSSSLAALQVAAVHCFVEHPEKRIVTSG
jgi:hypothetical protein